MRERKKLKTRNALVSTARRLFAEKGYEATTLEEICEEVQIHVTTFFSYFESKEELAFSRMIEALEDFRTKLHDRGPDIDALSFWWKFLDDFGLRERREESHMVVQIEDVPALRNRFSYIVSQYQEEIARAIAEEAGNEPEADLYAHLYAATLMSTLVTGSRWYTKRFGRETEPADTAGFSRLVLSRFPSREEVEGALRANSRRKSRVRENSASSSRRARAKK